jgi:hypothetical protein
MKRTLTLMALIATTIISAYAQRRTTTVTRSSDDKPSSYLGLSGGINNISGLVGITFETPISENVSGKLGLGFGGWGVKTAIAGKYYKQYATSWSFGAGYSTAGGAKEVPLGLSRAATPNTIETIKMTLDRAHMIDLVAGKSWGRKVKFGIELGYSIKVAGGTYSTVDKSIVLSNTSITTMKVLVPGGLVLGLGLMFRL